MSIVFDKTGTLTHGVLHVSHVVMFVPRSDMSLQTVLAITGSAETSSEHPIGRAIATYVKKVVVLPRDAMRAWYMLRPCVHLSVTSRSSTETTKRRITKRTKCFLPNDGPLICYHFKIRLHQSQLSLTIGYLSC